MMPILSQAPCRCVLSLLVLLPRLVAAGVLSLAWVSSGWTAELNFGYYDESPPLDTNEEDQIKSPIQHKRQPPALPDLSGRPAKAPGGSGQERGSTGGSDEVSRLRETFERLHAQRFAEQAPSQPESPPAPSHQPPQKPAQQPDSSVDEDLAKLSKRVEALEEVLVGTEERPGLAGLIGGYTRRNGFFIMSENRDFFLRLPLLFQADFRSFPSQPPVSNVGGVQNINQVHPSTFTLQRVRPMVHFRIARYFRGLITPDFGSGVLGNGFSNSASVQNQVSVPDAFMEWDYFSAFRVRIGKFKSPIGLEMLQATQNLSFMERSLTRNLLPNRDLGAMVWGYVKQGLIEYQLGVFNGSPNADFYAVQSPTSNNKAAEARVFSRPFLHSPQRWLRGFGLGIGGSYTQARQTNGQNPMQTETFSYTFFQYKDMVESQGALTRVSPQVAWYVGRLGVLGQYVRSSQALQAAGKPQTTIINDAWSGQLSWFLTNDTATFGHVEPRHPFEFSNLSSGNWGAWEVAVRYAQLNIDGKAFSNDFALADPASFAQRAKSTTVGVNWYLNANVRFTANYVHTDFTGATRAYSAASHEDGLMFRAQLVF